ncbi:MAG TPA: FkbM family methyltransferase [Feifaniaceae bacterium]|nr:FkbM family methyltransferase [Feifaniaceae bacterium]
MSASFQREFDQIEERYRTGRHVRNQSLLKERLLGGPIVLFGLGFFAVPLYRNFRSHGMDPICFCDSRKSGTETSTGRPIISPALLKRDYADANIVIAVANSKNQDSIFCQLLDLGFAREQIFSFTDAFLFLDQSVVELTHLSMEDMKKHLDGYEWAYDFFPDCRSKEIILDHIKSYLFHDTLRQEPEEAPYFPDLFSLTPNEVFVDAGLYTGDTTEEFIRRTSGEYRAIYGFDIDETNLGAARRNLAQYPGIVIEAKGLWNAEATLCAELELAAGSKISDTGAVSIPVVALDAYFAGKGKDEWPSFMKLDIEGSEKKALLGSADIIRQVRPRLAVCAYHKPEDLYDLAQTILSIRGDYSFALRHYSPYTWDTVLYAY